jgi:hypothetical protein
MGGSHRYREFPVPPELSELVSSMWLQTMADDAGGREHRSVPAGCVADASAIFGRHAAASPQTGTEALEVLRRLVTLRDAEPEPVMAAALRAHGAWRVGDASSGLDISGRQFRRRCLAALAGYADQPHLTRECLRLTGQTPRAFVRQTAYSCGDEHDHRTSTESALRMSGLINN